jgi:5-(carboxyamino)imidazole ribonucleotide synthase
LYLLTALTLPAIYYCDDFIISSYENKKKLDFFIKNIDLATFEFENIPFKTLDYVEKENQRISKTFYNKNSSR